MSGGRPYIHRDSSPVCDGSDSTRDMAPATGNYAASQASRPQHQETGTPRPLLLLLPLELRLICYEYAFSYPSSSLELPSTKLSLLLTCAQINAESRLLAYSLTAFVIPFTLISELPSRLRRLRDDQVRSIRSLTVSIDPRAWLATEKTHEYFLPRLDPDGLARLRLNNLNIRLKRAADQVCDRFFMRAFCQWELWYFGSRRAWMDTISAERSMNDSFKDLIAQWLQTIHANVLLVTEEQSAYPFVEILYQLIVDDPSWYDQWQLKTGLPGESSLEMTRLDPVLHA
ncbi:hypothetical protein K491DRAFT_688978 [Lophiostoma macrostomum CBS 122681]|uniref:Uncharacterized protein n=1 Tax=Lophiostoma macrostomum CBS 122681 TaxID=1314788 RepID=A0A6A6TI84_9PLEO|nr:hypothetical protein K491DRAFT_688978 [Lophiostoma macrostomum CBS 122681]